MDYRAHLRRQAREIQSTASRARDGSGLERLCAARQGIMLIQQLRQAARQVEAEGVTVTMERLEPLERDLETLVRTGLAETARQLHQLIDGTPQDDPLRISAIHFLGLLLERHHLGSDPAGRDEFGTPPPD